MIIHLPQPFSFFLPSALFPEGRDEDGKECDGFESAEEHGEADDEFAEIGECRVGTGGSELAEGRPAKTEDVVSVGDVVTAKCIGIDDKGRVKMSIRAALRDAKAAEAEAAGITE